jgi:hypothetical protein
MIRKFIRLVFMVPVLMMLSGCIVYGGGHDRWHPHYFHDRW